MIAIKFDLMHEFQHYINFLLIFKLFLSWPLFCFIFMTNQLAALNRMCKTRGLGVGSFSLDVVYALRLAAHLSLLSDFPTRCRHTATAPRARKVQAFTGSFLGENHC
jgi:hypothetical protein